MSDATVISATYGRTDQNLERSLFQKQRWEFIKENKLLTKKKSKENTFFFSWSRASFLSFFFLFSLINSHLRIFVMTYEGLWKHWTQLVETKTQVLKINIYISSKNNKHFLFQFSSQISFLDFSTLFSILKFWLILTPVLSVC